MVSIFFSILMIFRDKSECRTNSTCTDLMVANSTLASAFSKFSCRISSDGRANRYASKMRMVSNTSAIPTQINASLVFKGKMNIFLVAVCRWWARAMLAHSATSSVLSSLLTVLIGRLRTI